jgi:hypothetical protein
MREAWDAKGNLIYVAPNAVRFDIEQVEFLLPWLEEMKEGRGPHEPVGGYIESKQPGVGHRAPYENWTQVAAELDARLAMTGLDHYLAFDYYRRIHEFNDYYRQNIDDDKWLIKKLGDENNLPGWEVRSRIRSVVSYIASGDCRRWVECSRCGFFSGCKKAKKLEHKRYSYREWRRDRAHLYNKEVVRG